MAAIRGPWAPPPGPPPPKPPPPPPPAPGAFTGSFSNRPAPSEPQERRLWILFDVSPGLWWLLLVALLALVWLKA